jgi:hypothetical protein
MAEFLKAKTTTFVNRPLGIISTRTGAAESFEALSRAGQQAQQMFYEEAVDNQKKAGRDYVQNLRVQARDEDGNLTYTEIDKSLSQVATREAEPLLRAKMSNALLVDASKQLNKIRAESPDAKTFESKANNYIQESMKQLDNTGGGQYTSVYQQLATKTMAQHLNHMVLADAKKAQLVDTQNALYAIETGLNELSTSITEGVDVFGNGEDEFDTSQMIDNLKNQATMLLNNGDIQEPKYRDIINKIEKTTMDAMVNNKIAPMSNNMDLNGLFIIEEAVRTGSVTEEQMKYLEAYDIDQEDIDGIRNIRSNRDYHASRIANIRSLVSQKTTLMNKGNAKLAFANKLDNKSIFTMKPKEQEMYNDILGDKYNDGKGINAQWVLQNWDKGDFISDSLKGSRLPLAIENIFNNAEYISVITAEDPQRAKANMLSAIKLFSNIMYRQDIGGNKLYEYGLSTENHSKWMRLKRLSEQYGDDRVIEFTQQIFAPTEDQNIRNNIRINNISDFTGYDTDKPTNPSNFINRWLFDFAKSEDMNPEAATYLKSIAMHHVGIQNTSESVLKQILKDSYENMYVKSKYVWNIGQGSGMEKSLPGGMSFKTLSTRFAPEKYFAGNSDLENKFIGTINKRLTQVTSKLGDKYEIGKNAFLLPSRRSTNTQGEYMVVDETGTPILNKQTNNIFQVSTKIVDKEILMKRREEQEERWDRARKRRMSIIQSKEQAGKTFKKNFGEMFFDIFSKTGR